MCKHVTTTTKTLQHAKTLPDVTHVIVDEIHERDLNTDFLLVHFADISLFSK